uniref:USP domain-containing protein n=1 Tax=Fundulus heteroclitus TaxID=8078 RepID=A0A3Q2PV02_FUNHE
LSSGIDKLQKLDMHHHPDVLTLLLKRFKFDYQAMDYMKIKCHVKIPEKLKIPSLNRSSHQSQTYQLYALVEHSGELRSGHYTARIRSQDDDKWYTFNDSTVTLVRLWYSCLTNTNTSAYKNYLYTSKNPDISHVLTD